MQLKSLIEEMINNRLNEAAEVGIIKYPDTSISYVKKVGKDWKHIYDKSYGYKGTVDKADMKHFKSIQVSDMPSRLRGLTEATGSNPDVKLFTKAMKSNGKDRDEKVKFISASDAEMVFEIGDATVKFIVDTSDYGITVEKIEAKNRKTGETQTNKLRRGVLINNSRDVDTVMNDMDRLIDYVL